MPGFETIVRPVVFPNIRPAPTRSLPPADDPEQGKCIIGGSGGGIIAVTENISTSGSSHNPKEIERRVDKLRVYQKKDDGTINKKNFVDLEVANRITMESDIHEDAPSGGAGGYMSGSEFVKTDTPEIRAELQNRRFKEKYYYGGAGLVGGAYGGPIADNIKILETNKIIRSGGE